MQTTSVRPVQKDPTADGVPLEYVQTVLVKFFLGTFGEVAKGIPELKRPDKKDLEQKHIETAKKEEEDPRVLTRGRIRPGQVDTGFPAYSREQGVILHTFAEGLLKADYGLRDVHFYQSKWGCIVVFAFEFGTQSASGVEWLKKTFAWYATQSYTVDVWDNPNLVTTVNCTNPSRKRTTRQLEAGPTHIRIV